MEYDNNNTGALFRNNKKNFEDPEDKKPDYTGQAEINHVEYWMSAWKRKAKESGNTFLSFKFEPKEKKEESENIPF